MNTYTVIGFAAGYILGMVVAMSLCLRVSNKYRGAERDRGL
jgi:hypothetical protein